MLLSLNGNAEFKPRFCGCLQTGKVTEIQLRDWRPLICSRCKGVLKQDHEWKAELSWSPSIYHGAVSRTSARLSNRNIHEVSTWGRGRDRCPLCFCLVFYCYFLSNDKQNYNDNEQNRSQLPSFMSGLSWVLQINFTMQVGKYSSLKLLLIQVFVIYLCSTEGKQWNSCYFKLTLKDL